MNVRDLRIGNYVQKTNGRSYTIKRLDNTNDVLVNEEMGLLTLGYNLEGIPLTEEWLIKFGFTKKIDSETLTLFWIGHNKLTHDYLFEVKHIEGYPFFYRNGTHAIHYVHQLQNLYYALTNQELTIKE